MRTFERVQCSSLDTSVLYNRQYFLLWISFFFTTMSLGGFFLFPLFVTQNGGSKSDIGIMMGAMMLSSVLFRPWASQMVDHFGRKKLLFSGSLILTGILAIHVLFKGDIHNYYELLLVARILHGLGIASVFTSSFTFISDIVPENRLNEGLGFFGISGLIGMAAGPTVTEFVINQFGFEAFFLTCSSFAIISLFFQIFLQDTFIKNTSRNIQVSFFSVLKRKKNLGIGVIALLFGMTMAAQGGFVAPYAKFLGLSNISLFFLSYSVAAILTRLGGSKIADRIGEKIVLPWALGISAIGYLILIVVSNIGMLAIAGLVTGAGHGILTPCLNSLAIRNEPAQIRGKINGVFTGFIDSGNLFGSVSMGYISEYFGFGSIFFTMAVFLIIGLLSFTILLKKIVL